MDTTSLAPEIRATLRAAVDALCAAGHLAPGSLIVLGCSTSEVAGGRIGKASVPKLGPVIAQAMLSACAVCLIALSIVFFPKLYGNMVLRIIGIVLIVEAVSDLLSIRRLSHLAQDVDVTYTIHDD